MGVIAFLSINLCNQSYAQRQSGYELMSPENQRMQNDLNLNPAYFWILDGQDIWNSKNNPNRSRVHLAIKILKVRCAV